MNNLNLEIDHLSNDELRVKLLQYGNLLKIYKINELHIKLKIFEKNRRHKIYCHFLKHFQDIKIFP